MAVTSAVQARLRSMITAGPRAAQIAASRVEAQGRRDITTRRGNIPWFKGPIKGSSNIPFTVKAVGANLDIRGVKWAVERASRLNFVAGWTRIVKQAAREALKGKR